MNRDQVIASNPIADFVRSRGHELKRAGENFVSSGCPLTHHKHSHFPVTIYPKTQSWTCHDCKIGGTIIDWVMHETGVSAADALRGLGGGRNGSSPVATLVKTYDYTDESRNRLFQTCRYVPKHFKQRRPDSKGGWIWNLKGVRRVLYRLPELLRGLERGSPVIVTEGEKDADYIAGLGGPAVVTCNPMGAGKWRGEYSESLRGANVFVIADKDQAGREHAERVAASLNGNAKRVAILELPNREGHEVKDTADWIAAGGSAGELADLLKAVPECLRPQDPPRSQEGISARLNSSKPKVELPCDGRLLSTFAAELAAILKDHGIYQRGGLAFIVNQQRDGLEIVTAQMLRTLAEKYLVCFRKKGGRETELSLARTMSAEDAQGVLCAQQFLSHLPHVEKVATARLPVMRRDNTIALPQAGYDPESLALTAPHCDYNEAMPFSEAKRVIDELLSEFPFADSGRSKAVAVSAMVGLFAAGLLPKEALRPVFIYLANAEGAGKTMLAKTAISPVHGLVKTDGDLKEKAETSKELLTAVIEARPYILFDNCKKHLDSPYLEAFATSVLWNGRILGLSKSFCGANNVTVFVTGNGCTVSPDMRRRSLFVELFMEDERAEDRKLRRWLDDAALLDMRADILSALWELVREWNAADRPKPSRTHSGFPRWSEIIGGIVEFAGYSCPLETAEIQSASDIDGTDMRELVNLLSDGEPVKFDELTATAREHGLFERFIESEGDLKPADKSAFGKLLARYDRRVFGGCTRFVVDGKGHSRRFRVVTEDEALHGQHGQHGVSID